MAGNLVAISAIRPVEIRAAEIAIGPVTTRPARTDLRNDHIGRINESINKAEAVGSTRGQIRSTDALQRVFPTAVASCLPYRVWICPIVVHPRSTGALSYPFSTPPHYHFRWIGAQTEQGRSCQRVSDEI